MSAISRPQPDSGKINLEQQRKRAKELLTRLRDGTAAQKYYSQLAAGHPRSVPALTDAQWLIANELGFSSWMKLKAHIDAINFAASHPDFEASDEVLTTHWRCGNDIAHKLRVAGFKGHFRMLTDPLCMGPVNDLPFEAFSSQRSAYISRTFGIAQNEALHRLEEEYQGLRLIEGDNHHVLWCEADTYDQLFLIRVLAGVESLPTKLELIQVNSIPGVSRFIGIGQLAPDVLAWLWQQRQPVTMEAIRLARQAWSAFCSTSPVALSRLAHRQHPALPLLAAALFRQLQELPSVRGGLSLTERLTLQILAEKGPLTFGRVFSELTNSREPLPFLGDAMFHALLRPLIDTDRPLLTELDAHPQWEKRTLNITPLGHQALSGVIYWPAYTSHERWSGGVCIKPGQPHWMIDENNLPVWRDAI